MSERIIINTLLLTLIKMVSIDCSLLSQERVDGHIVSLKEDTIVAAGKDYIDFYQRFLSGQKKGYCAMYPSCSNYGKQLLNEQNLIVAIPQIADRLVRCSHDRKYYERTTAYGVPLLLDMPQVYDTCFLRKLPCPHTDVLKTKQSASVFINHLINEEEYSLALLEVERKLFYDADPSLYVSKLICYRGLGKQLKGVYEYETLFPDSIRKLNKVNYQAALSYYELQNYDQCIETLQKAVANLQDSLYADKAYRLIAISQFNDEDLSSTICSFSQANRMVMNKELLMKNLNLIDQFKTLPKKKSSLAKALSVVPGLGYLYTGHKESALTSFIINGALGYATYSCIKGENYGMAVLCGFLNLSFYIGNINGAGRSAIRYNDSQKQQTVKKLELYNQIFLTH